MSRSAHVGPPVRAHNGDMRIITAIGFVLFGLAAWVVVPLALLKCIELVGGQLGELIRFGDETLIGLWYVLIPGFVLGCGVCLLVGYWCTGAAGGTPDRGFYAAAAVLLVTMPLAATSLGLAWIGAHLS